MVRYCRFFDTPDTRGSGHGFSSNSGLDRYHGHHQCHPYWRCGRGYFLNEFNKSKPLTFDGELKKLEDAETWFLGMKKLFELHDYTKNMKTKIVILSSKGNHTFSGKM